MNSTRYILLTLLLGISTLAKSQIGDHRNDLSIGFSGGYMMSNVAFVPKATQGMLGGKTFGFTARYVCEKYFNAICAVQLELNYSQPGWKESILSVDDEPCILRETGEPARYSRTLNYLQMPFLAHMGFGREEKGFKFFVNAGPQFGLLLSEKTDQNFTIKYDKELDLPTISSLDPRPASQVVAQDTMAVENKFDYGITAGLGLEMSMKRAGHVILEARYYYGLGNLYGDSKRDYFARSNINSIVFRATYLFDIIRTKNIKRK